MPAPPQPTPVPTQTPVPGIVFTVDRTDIRSGECVVFGWSVENVREVYFYAEGERWQDNGVVGEGQQRECPPHTTTYYLRVVKLMYFDEVEDHGKIEAGMDLRLVLSANGLAVLFLGLFPSGLIALCSRVIG